MLSNLPGKEGTSRKRARDQEWLDPGHGTFLQWRCRCQNYLLYRHTPFSKFKGANDDDDDDDDDDNADNDDDDADDDASDNDGLYLYSDSNSLDLKLFKRSRQYQKY